MKLAGLESRWLISVCVCADETKPRHVPGETAAAGRIEEALRDSRCDQHRQGDKSVLLVVVPLVPGLQERTHSVFDMLQKGRNPHNTPGYILVKMGVTLGQGSENTGDRSIGARWIQTGVNLKCLCGMRPAFQGRYLWARGYFCYSSGNVSDEVIATYIAEQNINQEEDFKVDGSVHLLVEAGVARDSFCRPLAGTGLTARYESHRLEAVVCHLQRVITQGKVHEWSRAVRVSNLIVNDECYGHRRWHFDAGNRP